MLYPTELRARERGMLDREAADDQPSSRIDLHCAAGVWCDNGDPCEVRVLQPEAVPRPVGVGCWLLDSA